MNDLSPDSRAILDAAGDPRGPSPAARSRMKRALATHAALLAGAGATAAAAGGGAALSTGASALAQKIVIGLVLLGAAAGTTVWRVSSARHELRTAAAPRALVRAANFAAHVDPMSTPVAPSAPVAPMSVAPPPPIVAAAPSPEPPVDAPNPPARHTHVRASSQVATTNGPTDTVSTGDTLADELDDIRAAQAALNRGDPTSALAALARHASRFRNGTLREERHAMRVMALCAVGRASEAREEAHQLLAENPHSPQAGRVRASCVGAGH